MIFGGKPVGFAKPDRFIRDKLPKSWMSHDYLLLFEQSTEKNIELAILIPIPYLALVFLAQYFESYPIKFHHDKSPKWYNKPNHY